jgi:hypothetical protein
MATKKNQSTAETQLNLSLSELLATPNSVKDSLEIESKVSDSRYKSNQAILALKREIEVTEQSKLSVVRSIEQITPERLKNRMNGYDVNQEINLFKEQDSLNNQLAQVDEKVIFLNSLLTHLEETHTSLFGK